VREIIVAELVACRREVAVDAERLFPAPIGRDGIELEPVREASVHIEGESVALQFASSLPAVAGIGKPFSGGMRPAAKVPAGEPVVV